MAERKQAAPSANAVGAGKGAGGAKTVNATDSIGAQDGRAASVGEKGRSTRAAAATSSGDSTGKALKAARAGGGAAAGKAGSGARPAKQPDLRKDLREFASARPQGWDHDDWLTFLEDLKSRGHNIDDREAIGSALEKERLHVALGALKGIGPQKRQSLVEYYGNLWQLRHADLDEIARVGNLQRKDAERIKADLR